MSSLYEDKTGFILSHSDYINKIYQETYTSLSESPASFTIRDELFDINHPFKKSSKKTETESQLIGRDRKRRKRKCDNLEPEAQEIKERFENLINLAKQHNTMPIVNRNCNTNKDLGNESARHMAEYCTSNSQCLRDLENCNGGNDSRHALYQSLKWCDILLPNNSRFICGDVRKTLQKLDGQLFDLIILDPPWWNKYIRRSKAKKPENSYEMLYNSEIADLPIGSLLNSSGLVAVWCTNCSSHENDVKEVMFKKWNVKYEATWFWMKITKDGIPQCPFTESTGKKPYERLIIGSRNDDTSIRKNTIPEKNLIVSVPSALHSHKPPLNDILLPYTTASSPKYLEVFARYLLPNTTSVGLEPLRWQHSSLYKKIL